MILRRGQGFTMVELLVTIALLSILGGISSGVFISFKEDARRAQTTKNMLAIKTMVRGNSELNGSGQFTQPGYLNDMGRYPANLGELTTQGAQAAFNPFNKRGWRGNYVVANASNWSQDSWGTNYSYDGTAHTIRSCGVDKTCGNSDDVVVYLTAEGSSTSSASSSSGGSSSSTASSPTPVDGGWTSWGSWTDTSACLGTCGTGSKGQIRWRTCTSPTPAYGGAPCSGLDNGVQTITCSLSACPIDGGWTSWTAWTDTTVCTLSCGSGTLNQQQTRTCTNPSPQYGGASCVGASSATQTIACNTFPCAINGGWSTASNFTTTGVLTYDNRYCNNPPTQFGGTDCTVESGWTDLGGSGTLHHEQKLSSCTNNTTTASSCTACAAGQVFLPSGVCGACSGTYSYPSLSGTIGSVGGTTTIGGPSACSVTINGAVTALGTITIQAAAVSITGTLNGTGGGGLGGNGGIGGVGSAASNPASGGTGNAGSVGTSNTSGGTGGAHGTGGASCNSNPCTGGNGTAGGNGVAGSNATSAGQLGGGGGGGGGGAGGGYGKYKTNCDSSKSYGFTLTPGGGGGGGAGGSGGAAISVIAYTLTGNGTITVLGDSLGGNGGNGGQPTAGALGTATVVGTSNNGNGSAGLSCTISGTTKTGGAGGNGGDGGAGGAGSVSFSYSGAKGHTIAVSRGSGYFTNN